MLRLFLSSLIALFFTACLSTSSILLAETKVPEKLDESSILQIAIPVREHGYSNFDTQVLSSNFELETFIATVEAQKSWNEKENFLSSLTLLPIDFKEYNLLLYRMTETSGSTVLAVDAPRGTNKHVLIEIGKDKPSMGTADMAYYALAYKVAKSVDDITFDNGIKKHVIKNKALNIQGKANVPKACIEWYDGCNNCGRVGTAGDVVCTERYCIQKGSFKCTKWKEKKPQEKESKTEN
ncbi:MAG: Unknown protein [uncultured Sulfurovum sp.]|uniref:Uncharacterized protein n=1 Tax=uncultured Sulfurovum sp. TaxID=269237 RepID=A0A6S6S4U6_9BACT|nr:MAG: Unknown protein [uncultured Sulfurovum sp.]